MPHTRYSTHELVERGKALYEREIRSRVQPGDEGKYLVIDIESGDYEVDRDRLTASNRAAQKHPGAPLFAMRIGYATIGRIGARLRVEPH
jgi:hypothetical protein